MDFQEKEILDEMNSDDDVCYNIDLCTCVHNNACVQENTDETADNLSKENIDVCIYVKEVLIE